MVSSVAGHPGEDVEQAKVCQPTESPDARFLVVAESCGEPVEVVSPGGEVFAHGFPVPVRYAERGRQAVGSATIDAGYAGVRDGYEPGPFEVQQLGSFGSANVAALPRRYFS